MIRGFKTFFGRQINVLRNISGYFMSGREMMMNGSTPLNSIVNNPLKQVLNKENPINGRRR
jgi:hypothetical protein